jgi:hypothetical protein
MVDKKWLVRFTDPSLAAVVISAARIERHGEHLVFLLASGELAALFLFEGVSTWLELAE